MCKLWNVGRGVHLAAAGWLCLVLSALTVPSSVRAACLPDADPAMRILQTMVGQDAKAALRKVQSQLALDVAAVPRNARRLASLYGIEAQAFSILELETDARAAVAQGLQYAPDLRDPVRLDLLATLAENVFDQADIESADQAIAAAHAVQAAGSLADTCLLIGRGLLQSRAGRDDLAIGSLSQAYQASNAPRFAEAHSLAAGTLSSVLRNTGDYPQALNLNQEAIEADIERHAPMQLSVDRFLRGRILMLMHKYASAIEEFEDARRLSGQFDDSQGVAFTDVRICESRIQLGQLDRAAASCDNALAVFTASKYSDEIKDTQALLARIDLAQGRPEKALATLDHVLAQGGADLLPIRIAGLYELRSRTRAALHDYRGAYADLGEYMRRYTTANDLERARQVAALRAQFETDREVGRNALLKRELDVSRERAERQALQLRWDMILTLSGALVIAALIYFLFTNLRYRKQLTKIANEDGLTGLPNRRRTAELADAALSEARDTQAPLCIGLLDLDHFKIINDRCGHTAGDQVLREFADAGREVLRPGDVLGRWGGEEFLLVMPNATMEVALATLDRLRTRLFGVQLPSAGVGLRVSVSAGVVSNLQHGRSLDELIARADAALYVAKNEGRDLVRVADENFLSSTGIRRIAR
jgi:diguanylate cyclase (GGDEF)-like protein